MTHNLMRASAPSAGGSIRRCDVRSPQTQPAVASGASDTPPVFLGTRPSFWDDERNVAELRRLLAEGLSEVKIAAALGCARSTIIVGKRKFKAYGPRRFVQVFDKPENVARAYDLRDLGWSADRIAAELGCAGVCVSAFFKRQGLASVTIPNVRRGIENDDPRLAEYRRLGWSMPKIAEELNVSCHAVRGFFQRNGLIPYRPTVHRDRPAPVAKPEKSKRVRVRKATPAPVIVQAPEPAPILPPIPPPPPEPPAPPPTPTHPAFIDLPPPAENGRIYVGWENFLAWCKAESVVPDVLRVNAVREAKRLPPLVVDHTR